MEAPVPCSEAQLAEMEAWKQRRDEEAGEEAKAAEHGGPADPEKVTLKVRESMGRRESKRRSESQ